MICAWAGERELALGQLEAVAKIPGVHTYGNLRLSPMWDPLRGEPRFEKIVDSLAPKKWFANNAVVLAKAGCLFAPKKRVNSAGLSG